MKHEQHHTGNAPDSHRRRILLALAGSASGLWLSACGGGTDAGQTSPDPPAPEHPASAIIAAARTDNAFVNPPWSRAPSYLADTPYFRGGLVRGLGDDANRLYQQVMLLGRSGLSSPPAGNGPDGMVDGSAAWLYWGEGVADSTIPLLCSVPPTGPGDLMDGLVAFVQASPETLGLTRTYPMSFATPPARVSGGNALIDNDGFVDIQGPVTGNTDNLTRATSARRHRLHFRTDARKWLAVVQRGPMYPTGWSIEVNRRLLTEGDVSHGAMLNPGCLLLNMGLFGPGPHDVVLRKFDAVSGTAVSLAVGPGEAIWPAPDNGLTVAFEGDSITQGGGIGSQSMSYLLDTLVGVQLGASSTYNNAIGGTGLISNLQGTRTTYLDRLPDIAALQPTILVHGGYHNDEGLANLGISRAQRVAAILDYFGRFRAACPFTTFFQFPVQTLEGEATGPGSSLHTLELDVIEAFNRWGDANAVLVPLLTASQPFPASTADTWYFQTRGAIAEFRDGHPVQRYYPDFATRVVAAIRTRFGVPA